jgi:hypothetical protein
MNNRSRIALISLATLGCVWASVWWVRATERPQQDIAVPNLGGSSGVPISVTSQAAVKGVLDAARVGGEPHGDYDQQTVSAERAGADIQETSDDLPAWMQLPVLSPAWVTSFLDICETQLGNCRTERELAERIATEPKGEEDSWPHRLEFELGDYFSAIASANQIENSQVTCNRIGCLAYLTGNQRTLFGSGYWKGKEAFMDALGAQAWSSEFVPALDRISGSVTNHPALLFPSHERQFGVLLIFVRKARG